ncbi:MAG: helix-hairpin-helix domain-containing protein [Bacteroidota bacterium]|nr:helix-hairpin-helix domain-containing protein [Bacteroidota bacterium]
MKKDFIDNYFSFTSKERKGVMIVLAVLFFIIFSPLFFTFFIKEKKYDHEDFEKQIAQLKVQQTDSVFVSKYPKYKSNYTNNNSYAGDKDLENIHAEFFSFDPNTVSFADWQRLGVKDKTIATIQKYISKGGKFYKPEDIQKIWGLSPSLAQRLMPYVSIKNEAKKYASFEKKEYPETRPVYSPKVLSPIDVNLADTAAFISLPGIGSKLSQRIISFRDKLGGFYSIDQVGETYLLPDSTFQKIKPRFIITKASIKKININTASIEEMKQHPYLRYNIANAIFQYRQQHGDFNSVEDIKKIMLVTADVFNKASPYLTIL